MANRAATWATGVLLIASSIVVAGCADSSRDDTPEGEQAAAPGEESSAGSSSPTTKKAVVSLTPASADLQAFKRACTAIATSPDGKWIAVSGTDDSSAKDSDFVRIYETGKSDPGHEVPIDRGAGSALEFGGGGAFLVFESQGLKSLNLETMEVSEVPRKPSAGRLIITKDDSLRLLGREPVALVADDTRVHAIDLNTGQDRYTLDTSPQYTECVSLFPDGRHVAVGVTGLGEGGRIVGGKKAIQVWDLDKQEMVRSFELKNFDAIGTISISADGDRIATCSVGNPPTILDAATGEKTRELDYTYPGTVHFLKSGHVLALDEGGYTDHNILLVDTDNGDVLAKFSGHRRPVSGFALSADGTRLASCADNGTVKVFDVSRWSGSAE